MRKLAEVLVPAGTCGAQRSRSNPRAHRGGALQVFCALLLCTCGGASRTSPGGPAVAVGTPPQAAGASARTLARSAVRAALGQGLGAFLQHVELDDRPARISGKFHGFRITALRGPSFWDGVDLKPGDVVTKVNGFPIERPEQAQIAFESLGVAGELRVSYERDGEPRELVYSIVEDP